MPPPRIVLVKDLCAVSGYEESGALCGGRLYCLRYSSRFFVGMMMTIFILTY